MHKRSGGLVGINNAEGKVLAEMGADPKGNGRVGTLNSEGVWESL